MATIQGQPLVNHPTLLNNAMPFNTLLHMFPNNFCMLRVVFFIHGGLLVVAIISWSLLDISYHFLGALDGCNYLFESSRYFLSFLGGFKMVVVAFGGLLDGRFVFLPAFGWLVFFLGAFWTVANLSWRLLDGEELFLGGFEVFAFFFLEASRLLM